LLSFGRCVFSSEAEFITSEIGESAESGILIESGSSAGDHVTNLREVHWLVLILVNGRNRRFAVTAEAGGVLPTGLWCEANKASLGCREEQRIDSDREWRYTLW
jgi:hypothetical protein